MTIPMAIVDYIPVFMFLAAAVILQRDLYRAMSKGAFALFSAGTITVFVAGFYKATWKLLYAAGVCDFTPLNKSFFPMQTTGFVLAALGMLALLCHKQGDENKLNSVAIIPALGVILTASAPAEYSGTMIFVMLMVLGVLVLDVGLIIISAKHKQTLAAVIYGISFIFVMGMGYLSSRDFTEASMNWIAEFTNVLGQGTFLLATWMLHKKVFAETK
ncbi:MAG: hypothetical protein LUC38_06040 [Oscillospiraceae bacterium]|nr:hypothetical protein [Ruminococcus sp.]MCD8345504.1 hypothetical protein [Oscillospiraceae bacterium]